MGLRLWRKQPASANELTAFGQAIVIKLSQMYGFYRAGLEAGLREDVGCEALNTLLGDQVDNVGTGQLTCNLYVVLQRENLHQCVVHIDGDPAVLAWLRGYLNQALPEAAAVLIAGADGESLVVTQTTEFAPRQLKPVGHKLEAAAAISLAERITRREA